MDCSRPGFLVLHYILELAQTHVYCVDGAIQLSHPLSALSPPALNLYSIRVFSKELALHIRWPTYWSFSFSISPSEGYWGLISFRMDWSPCCPRGLLRVFSSIAIWKIHRNEWIGCKGFSFHSCLFPSADMIPFTLTQARSWFLLIPCVIPAQGGPSPGGSAVFPHTMTPQGCCSMGSSISHMRKVRFKEVWTQGHVVGEPNPQPESDVS